MSGVSTSHKVQSAQITSIERDGFWVLVSKDGEYFVPFESYPELRTATIEAVFNFEFEDGDFHWPDLDVDIELEALKHPEKYPLRFRR